MTQPVRPHSFTDAEFDLDDVREAVTAALGEPVAVVASWPAGDRLGMLRFERDVEGDEPALELDPALVEQALKDARRKERQRDQAPATFGRLLADLDAAADDAARWAVLRRLLEQLAAQETETHQRARQARRRGRKAREESALRADADNARHAFVSPRDRSRPGVLFTRAQREAAARARRAAEQTEEGVSGEHRPG